MRSAFAPGGKIAVSDLDARRTAQLLLSPELASGASSREVLERPELLRAVRPAAFRSPLRRLVQRVLMKAGRVDYMNGVAVPLSAARRSVLGDGAPGPPRLLVRVDEFPHARSLDEPEEYGQDRFEEFHGIMRDAGVPYLLAVTPRVSSRYLDPAVSEGRSLETREVELLGRLAGEGVAFGLHGYDHRTREVRPRRRTELGGLGAAELSERLEAAGAALAGAGVRPRVLVPPFNRFDADQWPVLADGYDVVCGGPESVARLGLHPGPQWRGDAVYLPAYPPLYGRAREILPALERLVEQQAALWVPVVLHWGWEADDGWSSLQALAPRLASLARPWTEFLEAVDACR